MTTVSTKQLDRIENAIIGNGHEGLLARTARIEEKLIAAAIAAEEAKKAALETSEKSEKEIGKMASATRDLAESVIKLETAVEAHVKMDHLTEMIRKKEFWAVIVVGFIFLHIVSTYVPSVWDWIMTMVGLPSLSLPITR